MDSLLQQPSTNSMASNDNLNKWYRCKHFLCSPWYRKISVEPTMFLYMFAFMITSVIEHDFFMQKACRVNNNFTIDICDHIKEEQNAEYKKDVQIVTARFYQWNSIAAQIFPIILALFLGSFSDRRGRKFPMLMGLIGKFFYSIMIVVNDRMRHWPLEYVIITATLPCALTGADVAIFASCFAYITDISNVANRTIRVTILDACYLSAMPLGVAFGSYLFYNQFQKSYAKMFTLNATLLAISIIYTILVLKWQTTSKQKTLSELNCCNLFNDFFDKQHVRDTFTVLIKPRPMHGRSYLILLLLAMALYTFQRDENQYLYLYTSFKFNWSIATYSTFKTIKSTAFVLAMLLGVPLMNKLLGWKDTTLVFVGAWAHTIARVFYFFANTGTLFYVGAIICSLGPVVGPMLRSMTSKIVPQSERGKVFALLSVCDNAVPFISGVIYSQTYRATLNDDGKGGDGVFLLTMATQLMVFLLILCIHIKLGENALEAPDVIDEHSTATNIANNNVNHNSINDNIENTQNT